MRQFEWDKSIGELCSSQEELRELEEIASLLQGMSCAEPSSSFQAELKAQLMKKALAGEKCVSSKMLYLARAGYKCGRLMLQRRSLLATAAAVLLIVSLTVFSNRGQFVPVPPGIVSPEKPPEITIAENPDPGNIVPGEYTPPVEQGTEIKPPEGSNNGDPGTGEAGPEVVTPPTSSSPPPSIEKPVEPPVTAEKPVGEGPEFEALKNLQNYRFAGTVSLPSVYYKVEQDAAVQAENVGYSWKPRKTVFSSDPGGAGIFGSEAWVAEDLSN